MPSGDGALQIRTLFGQISVCKTQAVFVIIKKISETISLDNDREETLV
jgi:hypothetical protein